ncbi:MAG: biotin--[acetyl-CoA-carboxylase] ligase [Anaerovoracaceae bacterium]|uniref:Bifunctional ligase/repressor BirA n=1 Tax=Candidatus Fimisoma avicola TaxID=2840826 RepID=A0A9D1I697_9FIRM|nr:biotin--[acetyl-CoA-carboxylase] ligase [Candidatus Fimisoma avicola]
MSTKLKVLEIFRSKGPEYVSGQELADTLGLSRNSVWKAIRKLQAEGFDIESKASVGYRLLQQEEDLLSAAYIRDSLDFPCKIHLLEEVDSTNDYAKRLRSVAEPHLIIADAQTKGRGRLGRSFYSPHSKGLYMTIAFEPDFGLDRSMLVSTIAALGVCQAIEEVTGLGPKIKWVNDIYLNGKKICGILTEAESNFETGTISRLIIGIGINCYEQVFPDDIAEKAAYITASSGAFSRNQLAASITSKFFRLLETFDRRTILREYRSRSMILGQPVTLYGTAYGALPENGGRGIKARAIDIDDNGGLVVEYLEGRKAREMETITSGEVTVRKDY